MFRFPALCLAFLTTLSVCGPRALEAASAAGTSEVICPRVLAGPVTDARLDDWPPLPQVMIDTAEDWHPAAAQFADYGGPEDVSADIRMAWDSQALYLALETRDDELIRVRSASEIDRGDSLVLSLAAEGSDQVNQFVVALLRGSSLVWRAQPAGDAGEVKTMGRALWARREEDQGWRVTYELAIPWAELRPIRPLLGQAFTFAFSACDDDGAGLEGCLERTVSVVFASEEAGMPVTGVKPRTVPPVFARPEVSRFERRAFVFHDQPRLLFGGTVDYARLPRRIWGDRVSLLKAAGMNVVGAAAVWRNHEPIPGAPDFSDLREFLDLCQREGLLVQLDLGPYAGESWEAGGLPGWLLARGSPAGQRGAVAAWYQALLPVVREYELSAGGPVAAVILRPVPDATGKVEAESLEELIELVRGAGIEAPLLTANAPAARDNSKQSLANLLDTLAFYGAAGTEDVLGRLQRLWEEENGPGVLSAIPGEYATPEAARRSASVVKAALAAGSTAVMVSDFAPGLAVHAVWPAWGRPMGGVVDAAGARTRGYGEMGLIGALVRQFGAELAGAVSAGEAVRASDPEVRVAARLGEKMGFIFLWDEKGTASRQVRLTYTPPDGTAAISIPEAGAITLPAGCAKMLVVSAPLGRGTLHYSTSEVAAIHRLGDRVQLVVYGDPDTPGEIALRWPGPPLVWGEVTRQQWDPARNLLILDYYHSREDRYLLVDELEIAILSRDRALSAAAIEGEAGAVTLSAGAQVAGGSLDAGGLEAELDCSAGRLDVSVALPRPPSSVMVDGEAVDFTFSTPARVLALSVDTPEFRERGGASVLDRLGRAVLGGPPRLSADFDRGWFMPDAAAGDGLWRPAASLGRAPEELGLVAGAFARLRASFNLDPSVLAGAAGAEENEVLSRSCLRITGSTDPAMVFVNGEFVPELSGTEEAREAGLAELAAPGRNEIEVVLHLLPRADGFRGVWEAKRVPEVSLDVGGVMVPIESWEVSPALAGESAGWIGLELDRTRWHFLRLGPWRRQGRELEKVWGVGWYRVTFGLPEAAGWRVPYYLRLTLNGTATVYINGARLATCVGDGVCEVPLPTPLLELGDQNILAAATYGLTPETGISRIEVAADRGRMTQRRTLSVRF